MDDEYDCALKSKSLKFKGDKKRKKNKKHENLTDDGDQSTSDLTGEDQQQQSEERVQDAEEHGGWWRCSKFEHIKEYAAIEFLPGCYARALSNGLIVLGNPHPPGECPDEEEIFTVVSAATNQIAFKSGFDRYLSVDSRRRLVGLSEAIGEPENFIPVFEDGKTALCAHNDCFLGPDEEFEEQLAPIVARASKVGSCEILNIRVNHIPRP